jgi:hypothetical protein
MRAKVQKWGNSLAERIPKSVAQEVGLGADAEIEMSVWQGELHPGTDPSSIRPGGVCQGCHSGEPPRRGRLRSTCWSRDPVGVVIMPRKDPIIEEIHAVREELAREAGYDLERMLEAARARQEAGGLQVVRLSPRKPTPRRRHPEDGVLRACWCWPVARGRKMVSELRHEKSSQVLSQAVGSKVPEEFAAEGALAVVLAPESGEPIVLSPAEERELLEAMQDIRRGEYVDGENLLSELRSLR